MTPTRYQLTPVPFTAVDFSDPFWAPRIETNRAASIPHIYRKLEETGRISAFDLNFERPRSVQRLCQMHSLDFLTPCQICNRARHLQDRLLCKSDCYEHK